MAEAEAGLAVVPREVVVAMAEEDSLAGVGRVHRMVVAPGPVLRSTADLDLVLRLAAAHDQARPLAVVHDQAHRLEAALNLVGPIAVERDLARAASVRVGLRALAAEHVRVQESELVASLELVAEQGLARRSRELRMAMP